MPEVLQVVVREGDLVLAHSIPIDKGVEVVVLQQVD